MRIKPVLVPDHDAAALRGLMDSFADASTGPTKKQLNESRAAVTAAQKTINEGFMDVVKQAFNDNVAAWPMGTSDEQFIKSWADDIRDRTGRDIPVEKLAQLYQDYTRRSDKIMQSHSTTNEESAERLAEFAPSDSGDGGGDDDGFDEATLRKLAAQWFNGDEDPQVERLLAAAGWEIGQDEGYEDEPGVFVVMSGDDNGRSYMSWPAEELRSDVAEARPDVMRHVGDQPVRVVKKGGKPIGEIGIDAGPGGNGDYYVKLYDGTYDAAGFDTAEEALAELRYAIKQMSEGVSEDAAANNPVVNAITRRIMLQRTDLLSKYGPEKIGQAVDEVADFVGDVEEIGSSDVSGWVRHVEQMLGNMSEGRDVPHNDPNLSKAYNLGYQAYRGLKNNPQLAQAAQDRIEADFPQYLKMWTRGYHDGERFDQEKNMSEASPTGVFKQGDKVKVHGKYNGTVVGQDGDTYYVQIDGHPGSQAVSAASLANPAAGVFKQGDKVKVHGKYNGTVVGQDGDTYYVQIDGQPGSQAVSAASLANPAATVAESIDPVEQLRADIRRFAR
jgi:hypothetical protein